MIDNSTIGWLSEPLYWVIFLSDELDLYDFPGKTFIPNPKKLLLEKLKSTPELNNKLSSFIWYLNEP